MKLDDQNIVYKDFVMNDDLQEKFSSDSDKCQHSLEEKKKANSKKLIKKMSNIDNLMDALFKKKSNDQATTESS